MEKLKQKIFDVIFIVVVAVLIVFIDNRNLRIVGGVVIIFLLVDIFSRPVEETKHYDESESEEENSEVISQDEIEEELLGDGEYSYDNYDEVCCPKCGAYLGAGVTQCKECGWGMSEYPDVCPACGKPNSDKLSFCAYCDYQFKKIQAGNNEKAEDNSDEDTYVEDFFENDNKSEED